MLRIALASPPVSGSVDSAMPRVERFIAEAAHGEADIVCFPECCIPGLRGQDFAVETHDPACRTAARAQVRNLVDERAIQDRSVFRTVDCSHFPGCEGTLNGQRDESSERVHDYPHRAAVGRCRDTGYGT